MAKYYVVREWVRRWIFSSRDEVKDLVVWVKWAKYKSFKTEALATEAFSKWFEPYYQNKGDLRKTLDLPFEKHSIAVDAACSHNPWLTEYQWVDLITWETIFHTKLWEWTNNIWEFLALVHGLSYLQKIWSDKAIYSDSKHAMKRIIDWKCRTNLKKSPENKEAFNLIKRAEDWLRKNKHNTKVLKRNTKERWEIPADFGRK
jgi:ribonuclease HI